jgi:predicted acyl esterase
VYETAPLDADVTFAGPMEVTLNVSTTGTDSDWVVKLVDVYGPDHPEPQPNPAHLEMGGYQQLVRGDVFRGKFRRSFEKPEPFTPGKAETLRFTMPDVLHTFRTGHRIMVQVQSTWFPLVDRNPQTFVNIPTANAADYRKATQRVHLGAKQGTSIAVRVLPAAVTP